MFGIEKDYQKLLEQVYGPLGEKSQMTEIEKVKAEIKVLEKKLALLEEIENQPQMNLQQEGEYAVVSYHDKVYYRLMNETTFSWYIRIVVIPSFPTPTLVMVEDAETERLLEGIYYNHIQVKKEKEQQIKNAVRESVKWCKEHPNESVEDYLTPKTPEKRKIDDLAEKLLPDDHPYKIADEHGETNPYKQYLNSVDDEKKMEELGFVKNSDGNWTARPLDWVKPQSENEVAEGLRSAMRQAIDEGIIPPVEKKQKTLTDLIERWWCDIFTTHSDWDMETSIDDLVDRIQLWLPKEQFANSQNEYVELTVEGFNDCVNKIKDNLR